MVISEICLADDFCDPFTITGASKECSNGDKVGSECKISCSNPNQILVGEETVTCEKNDSDSKPRWDPAINQRCGRISILWLWFGYNGNYNVYLKYC